ncbi:MAG: hydrolase [Spirochaetes bacterium]|nr:hydrolase [Spirochaetota bacterium]
MNPLGIIEREKTAFIQIDIQDKFRPAIFEMGTVIKNAGILARASEILNIPLIATEQYPEGLGKSIADVGLPEKTEIIKKIHFSCFGNKEFYDRVMELRLKSLILYGVEAHVCLLKTALDGLKYNFEIYLAADAVSSRTPENKAFAIERMRQAGVFIVTTEMILFQMLEYSGTEEFKAISKLIK